MFILVQGLVAPGGCAKHRWHTVVPSTLCRLALKFKNTYLPIFGEINNISIVGKHINFGGEELILGLCIWSKKMPKFVAFCVGIKSGELFSQLIEIVTVLQYLVTPRM